MQIIKHKTTFLIISASLVVLSLVAIMLKGLPLGLEFTGGFRLELQQNDATYDKEYIQDQLQDSQYAAIEVLKADNDIFVLTGDSLSDGDKTTLLGLLNDQRLESTEDDTAPEQDPSIDETATNSSETESDTTEEDDTTEISADTTSEEVPEQVTTPFTELRFSNVGPSFGKELKRKAGVALGIVMLAIILFVAWAFQKVSKPVSSWKYGVIAVIALIHDTVIPLGIMALAGLSVDSLTVVGLLSIVGLSVNDTIVVFDRIRENLSNCKKKLDRVGFTSLVNDSVNQTLGRSINTSLTLIVVLVALYIFGPSATQNLALVMGIGTLLGTYSSIFVASPLLTVFVQDKDFPQEAESSK